MIQRTRISIARAVAAAAAIGAASALTACASDLGPYTYSRGQVGAAAPVEPAVILSSRPIRIEGSRSGVGPVAGALLGGVAGAALADDGHHGHHGGHGGYRGRRGYHGGSHYRGGDPEDALAVVAGAIVGGLIGAAVEESVSQQPGVAYTVRMERTGEVLTIAQADGYPIPAGAPVWVEFGPRARVLPRNNQPAQGYGPGYGPAQGPRPAPLGYRPAPPPSASPGTYSGY